MANSQKAAHGDSSDLLTLLEAITAETSLPASGTELCLVEIDPHRAHVFWNIEPEKIDAARPLYMRVHDITHAASIDQADQSYEIEIHGLRGQWYLDFWRGDRTFVTEVGQHTAAGGFSVIVRSNEIHTPPGAAMPVDASVTNDPQGRPVLTELPKIGSAAETVMEPAFDKPDAAEFLAAKFPFEEWRDTGESTSEVDPETLSKKDEASAPARMAGDASVAFTEEEAEAWQRSDQFPDVDHIVNLQTENRAALEAYYQAAAAFPAEPETTHESEAAGPDQSTDEDRQPAPTPVLALEHLMGPSSMESVMRQLLTGLEAELHIRGQIPAGRSLTLYGRAIKLNEDGTFSVRRKLIPGSWILPLLFERGQDEQL